MSMRGSCAQLRVRAGAGEAGERLRREAAVLRRARHPGVEELREVEDEGDRVRLATTWIDGRHPTEAVASELVAPLEVVAGLLAVLSTTVADLHDIGVVHGSITDSNVVVGEGGQPILVGFETARRLDDPPRRRPASAAAGRDVAALGALLTQLVELAVTPTDASAAVPRPRRSRRRRPADLRATLLRLSERTTRRRAATPSMTARVLADALAALPGATLPQCGTAISPAKGHRAMGPPTTAVAGQADRGDLSQGGTPTSMRLRTWRSRPGRARAGLVLVGLLAVGLVARALSVSQAHAAAPPRPAVVDTSLGGPTGVVSFTGGVLHVGTARYAVGEAGDAVLLGHWMCGSKETVALVRRRDQSVWVFPAWPQPGGSGTPGVPITAVLVGRETGVVDAHRRPFGRCDGLWVRRADGSGVTLRPWAALP